MRSAFLVSATALIAVAMPSTAGAVPSGPASTWIPGRRGRDDHLREHGGSAATSRASRPTPHRPPASDPAAPMPTPLAGGRRLRQRGRPRRQRRLVPRRHLHRGGHAATPELAHVFADGTGPELDADDERPGQRGRAAREHRPRVYRRHVHPGERERPDLAPSPAGCPTRIGAEIEKGAGSLHRRRRDGRLLQAGEHGGLCWSPVKRRRRPWPG